MPFLAPTTVIGGGPSLWSKLPLPRQGGYLTHSWGYLTHNWGYLTHTWGKIAEVPGRVHMPVGLHTTALGVLLLRDPLQFSLGAHCINYLVRAGISDKDIIIVYTSIIRSILEYACPVWHPGLTAKQTKDIERVQKRCLKLIFPTLSYSEALLLSGLEELGIRRERITKELFDEIKHKNHVLHSLLPKRNPESLRTRNPYPYIISITKHTRFGRAFIPYCISKRY